MMSSNYVDDKNGDTSDESYRILKMIYENASYQNLWERRNSNFWKSAGDTHFLFKD